MSDKNEESLKPIQIIKDEFYKKLAKRNISIKDLSFKLVIIIILILGIFAFKYYESEENLKKGNWAPAGHRIKTKWAKNLNPEKVWTEYPRPQLQRKEWMNLNGPWLYSIRNYGTDYLKPEYHDGKILVPFSLESSLSGVMGTLLEKQSLWYEKVFEILKSWKDKNILLHFGAVDWKCILYINDDKVGEHVGGYSAFYFNITQKLKREKNKITLKVFDPTDTNYQPVGKQSLIPMEIWYTPISGIWQTVWLEPVNKYYIEKLEINNDFDNKEVKVIFKINSNIKLPLNFTLKYEDKIIGNKIGKTGDEISIKIDDENFHPWSPSSPNIYNISAELYSEGGYIYDAVCSYTTLRKIESKKDSSGYLRIYLNNKPIFNMGILDQGYWPDGLYTPPSEEAMIYDIQKLKDLGFNTIRKHVKIEPYRYYYQCDKIGMLVWQDMPAGDIANFTWNSSIIGEGNDKARTQESKDDYYKEWGEIIDNLKFFQCIIIWIPFNEAWGQFDTEKVVAFTKQKDPSRLINAASEGNHRICGNFLDLHIYKEPSQYLKEDNLINVLGEFGGLSLEIKNHILEEYVWGYKFLKSKEELSFLYKRYIDIIIKFVKTGFSAAIYTQTTDVESEINGLMTYDREEVKVYENIIKEANKKLISTLNE